MLQEAGNYKKMLTIRKVGEDRIMLAEQVEKGTEGAIEREWETKDGQSGVKYEKYYQSVEGKIKGIKFIDGKYGLTCMVELEEESVAIPASNASVDYFNSFAERFPNVDLNNPVKLVPYSMVREGTDFRNVGISVQQGGEKLTSAYTKDNPNGMPAFPEGATGNVAKAYFTDTKRNFLRSEVEKKMAVFAGSPVDNDGEPVIAESNKDEVSLEDLPF